MKYTVYIWAILAIIAVVFPATAQADDKSEEVVPAPSLESVAVIDLRFIAKNAKATKAIQEQLNARRDAYRKQVEKSQNALKKAEEELRKVKDELPKEELIKRTRAFEKQAGELQGQVQRHRKDLDKANATAMRTFHEGLLDVVGSYAKENNIEIILRRSQVFLAGKTMDITKDILAQIDKSIPTIKVDLPQK